MKRGWWWLLLVLVPRAAHADPLTLSEVVKATLERSPAIASASRERALADADRLSAEGGFDPSVKARGVAVPFGPYVNERAEIFVEQPTPIWGARVYGGWRWSRGDFALYDGKYVTNDYGEVRAGIGIPLLRDGAIDRRRAALERAEIGVAAAPLAVEQQKIESVRAASLRYWEWVAAGVRLKVARDLLRVAVERDGQLQKRVRSGDVPAIEQVDNERAVHQRTGQVAAAERALDSAALELSLYVRREDGSPSGIDASRLPAYLPEVEVPEGDERAAVARRPEPRRLSLLSDQAKVDRALAENQKKLGLELVVSGAKDLGPGDPKLAKPELEVMVLLDVPIFNRVQEGRATAAEATATRRTIEAGFAEDRVLNEVRDAKSAMARAHERLVAARREASVAEKLVTLEKERFELGEGTLFLVNLREQAEAEARLRVIDAHADLLRSIVVHRAAQGLR